MLVRVIKDILIILYILVVPTWIMELLGIDMYFAEMYFSESEGET